MIVFQQWAFGTDLLNQTYLYTLYGNHTAPVIHTDQVFCSDYVLEIAMNLLKLMQTFFLHMHVITSLNLLDDVWSCDLSQMLLEMQPIFCTIQHFFIAEGGIMMSGWNLQWSAACWFTGLQNMNDKWSPACWELPGRRWRLKMSLHYL